VRDAAFQTLIEIYKHVGDRLRADLRKKEIPPAKLAVLELKFDEVKSDGLLMPSALNSAATNYDEADTASLGPPARPTKLVKRTMSATASARKLGTLDTPSSASSGHDVSTQAGAVSQEAFESAFELVPQVTVFGQRDIDDLFKTINNIIGDKNMDWEKRVDALKRLRSLLMLNAQTNPNFPQQLKDLSIAFLDILKELRSQVIREACITLAYMSKTLRNKLDHFIAYIFQEMINLIQNSAKVISSAGTLALKYVIRFVHVPKLIPIVTSNLMQSKSKDIRSNLCELLIFIFEEWPTKALEKNQLLLRDCLKKGISDADAEARRHSRRCDDDLEYFFDESLILILFFLRSYWSFRKHFPDLADQLYGSFDIATQRQVEKERDAGSNGTNSMSASLRGSNSSLNSMPGGVYSMCLSHFLFLISSHISIPGRGSGRVGSGIDYFLSF
jgi:CLIP-associating protein 1/2